MAVRKERFDDGYDSDVSSIRKKSIEKEQNPCKQCGASIFTFPEHREEDGNEFCSQCCVDNYRKDKSKPTTGWAKKIEHRRV